MRTHRSEQQGGMLCPVRLLCPADVLRAGCLLFSDVLLHSIRLLRPAAAEK